MPSKSGVPHSTRLAMLEDEISQQDELTRELFYRSLQAGTSPVMAHMFAMRQATGIGTNSDTTFNRAQRAKMNGMHPMRRAEICKIAARAGISTEGKYYVGGLGRYNDPQAWVSTADEALATCRRKNLTADGVITHQGKPMQPKKKEMADDIRDNYVRKEIAADPKVAEQVKKNPEKKVAELREKVLVTHGPRRSRRQLA